MARVARTLKSRAPNVAEQKKEILKCGRDPIYFINNYVKISEPVRGLIQFKTFPYQDDCIRSFQEHQFTIVNKSRQLGLSTVSAAYSLWLCLFHKEKSILVVASQLDVAQKFQDKVLTGLDHLPPWLVMPKVIERNKTTLRFSNGSKVQSIATTSSAARGSSVSLLVIDEAAHIDGVEDLWLGVAPTLATGGRAVLISSPGGVGNLFHRIWVDAISGANKFNPIELPWTVHPERDQKWFEVNSSAVRAALGERGVAQEFLCDFLSSGDTFLPPESMDIISKQVKDPIYKHPQYPEFWIWEEPQEGKKYIITADVARGNADDYSTACVVNIDDDEVVAEYKSKVTADTLADVLMEVGRLYNTALLCPELNMYGLITAKKLKDEKYPNLYYEKHSRNVYSGYAADNITEHDLPGIQTTVKNRDRMLAKLEHTFRSGHIGIYSKRLLEELRTFIWRNGKAQAQSKYNDDLIMAYALAINLYENAGTAKYSGEDFTRALLQGISTNNVSFSPFGNPSGMGIEENHAPFFTSRDLENHRHRKMSISDRINGRLHRHGSNPQHPLGDGWGEFSWLLKD